MDIIDLSKERNRREAPAPEHIRNDDFGRPLFEYLCSYEMDGAGWSLTLWAYSMEDAGQRVAAIRGTLQLDGQIFESGKII